MSEWFDDEEVPCQNPGCVGDGTAIWRGSDRKRGKDAPEQCYECYLANKNQEDETIDCPNCEEEYPYKAKSIVWHRRNVGEWETPELCRFCSEHPEYKMKELSCQNKACTNTFKYGPRWQKKIADRGQEDPVLCEDCREANKAQQPVTITCEACEMKFTYSRNSVISWKRSDGWWEDHPVLCKPCFKDPDRVKRLKKEKEKEEKQKRQKELELQFAPRVGYYLLEKGKGKFEYDVDSETYEVNSNPTDFDVITDPSIYACIPDPNGTAIDHITADRHDWNGAAGTNDGTAILEDYVLPIVESTNPTEVIQCTTGRRWVKYEDETGTFVLIQRNEYSSNPPYRVYNSYPMGPDDAAECVISGRWTLDK